MLATIQRAAFRRWATGGGAPHERRWDAAASLSRSLQTAGAVASQTAVVSPPRASGLFGQEPACRSTYRTDSQRDQRSFSTTAQTINEAPEPLILRVIKDDDDNKIASSKSSEGDASRNDRPLVLMPPSGNNTLFVDSVESIVEAVNQHYSSAHFVGGMGEQDPGVWFAPASDNRELLHDERTLELLGDAMDTCRRERHGVPFAVYTSGVNVDAAQVSGLKWESVQVSLWAATPADYNKWTGRNDFGAVCGFIAEICEYGVPVEVGILRQYAGPASSLASSLGARHVHVYDI